MPTIGWLALLPLVAHGAKPWWAVLNLLEASEEMVEADPSPARCCFDDGDLISLRSDTDWFMGRCNGCVSRGAYPDSAFVHVSDPKDAPWAQWRVFNTCDGKLVLQADTGKYLGRCNNCAPGAAYPDQAFVHVEDWHTSPWAKWVCVDAGNGKIGLQADTGNYLARCNSCLPGAYPNAAFVHATSVSEAYAQWTVVSNNPKAGLCTSNPTTPTPTTTTCIPTTSAPATTAVTLPPSTTSPVTAAPTTKPPATTAPTTKPPTTTAPPPTTAAPVTTAPTTKPPTTTAPPPTTAAPVTTAPTTKPPTTTAPTTTAPPPTTAAPVTTAPTTTKPPAPVTTAPPPVTTAPPPVPSPCPRVRKAWTAHTVNEKALFQNALEQAMLRGFHHKFVEIHLETDSEHEAHDCLFFLWHRRYLLAYETMLRSLGDQYRCITLPFWDFGTLSAKFATGACRTFPECNPLLEDMGAFATGTNLGWQTYSISNTNCNAQTCVKSQHPVTRNFCQSQAAFASQKDCLRCIPRNNWASASPPADLYIANLYNQLFSSKPYDFTKVTKGVQYRYHNSIHGALSSTMGTFASPADPIFFVHHATVDVLYAMYYKCVVPANVDRKHSTVWPNPANWRPSGFSTSCSKSRRSDGSYVEYEPTDRMTMKLVGSNGGYVDVQDPSSVLKPFFDAVGIRTYADFYDIRSLGPTNSYSYDFGGSSLGALATQCDSYGRTTTSLLESDDTDDDLVDSKEDQFVREMYAYCKSKNVPEDQIMERINWMQCVFHNECKQGVFDYTDEFRSSFGVQGPPYCYTTISRLANQTLSIGVPGWELVYARHYSCESTVM